MRLHQFPNRIDCFCQMIRDYNRTCPIAKSISEASKISYLHRALGKVPELVIVKTQIQLATLG